MTGHIFTYDGHRLDEFAVSVRLTPKEKRAFARRVARAYRVPIALLGIDTWGCPPRACGWRHRKGRSRR